MAESVAEFFDLYVREDDSLEMFPKSEHAPNNSLDRSRGSVFRIKPGAAKVE